MPSCEPPTCECAPKPRRSLLSLIVPAIVLAALPKCPLCIVAYAAWLGIGISVTTAAWLRVGIGVGCVAALIVLAIRLVTRRR